MDLNEQDIAQIEAFLEGKLQGSEKETFETRMSSDQEFAAEVDLHRDLIKAVKSQGKAEMAAMLAGVHTEMANHPDLKPYKPSKGTKGGSKFGKFLFRMLMTAALILGGYLLAKKMGWIDIKRSESGWEIVTPEINLPTETHYETTDTLYYINGKPTKTKPDLPTDGSVVVDSVTKKETHPSQ